MSEPRIGVIGGSGLYRDGRARDPRGENGSSRRLSAPLRRPIVIGDLQGRAVAFLARHGSGHRIMPSELNFRANIFGFKTLGTDWLISVSAVGSMQPDYRPTDIVVPDQFYDRTRHRADTFFGDGLVAHVSMADPICPELRAVLRRLRPEPPGPGRTIGGTYLCMEGPQFSTRAESRIYRQWGIDVIGMTNLQEAKLAREAEISYATLAMVTDFDCWHDEEDDVEVANVLEVLRQNAAMAQGVVARSVRRLDLSRPCPWAAVCATRSSPTWP